MIVMFTLKLQVPVPHKFVAVQLTVVVPSGNMVPEAGVQVAVTEGVPPDGET